MQKQIKILLTLLTALILAVSCADNNPNDPNNTNDQDSTIDPPPANTTIPGTDNANFTKLKKTWQDNDTWVSFQYVITDIKFVKIERLYNDSVIYSVSIKEIVWNEDNTSGIIYGQYTTAPSYNPDVVNKYYAIAFKNLKETTIEIANASKNIGTPENPIYDSSAETLEEAKTKFTEADGYFYYAKLNVVQ